LARTEIDWAETWMMAVGALRANKVRAALTMLGVVIGSACIVLVVTVALTGKNYVASQIEAVGSNIVFASLEHEDNKVTALGDQISLGDMDAVQESVPQAVRVAGTTDVQMAVTVDAKSLPVGLIGVTPEFQQIRNLLITHGRYLDETDFATAAKVCVISQHLAQVAFPGADPIGQNIHIGELTFTVIGVFTERIGTFGQSEIRTDSAIVPLPVIQYYTGSPYLLTLYAQADSPEDVPYVTTQVANILKSRHRALAEYDVENLAPILETSQRISVATTIMLLLVALVALVISGVGIMNIMLVSVTERTREIGIRRAIGARRREILFQFLLEAILISGAGALAGIAIAVGLRFLIGALAQFLPVPGGLSIPISWLSVFSAFVVSCGTGVLFGYLPAKTAAQLHPVESLRYE